MWLSIGGISVLQQRLIHWSAPLDIARSRSTLAFFFSVALLTPLVFYFGRRMPVSRRFKVHPALLYLMGAPLFALAFAFVRWVIAPTWNEQLHQYVTHMATELLPLAYKDFATLFWIYLEILLTANAYVYFERARSEALDRAEAEQALAASELQALKAQLHPHFLFNTLHGIATLANEDGERASQMVLQLAGLLRSALEHSATSLVPLSSELRFTAEYLGLEKMRLGERLKVHWAVPKTLDRAQVPHLILQPLVENAIVHGIARSRSNGFIEITARAEGSSLLINIVNSVKRPDSRGTGLGLRNVAARLKYLYGDDASVQFGVQTEESVATAMLKLPLLLETSSAWEIGAEQLRLNVADSHR